jgi:hypothetical protein
MKTILLLTMLIPVSSFSQTSAEEEALILNQEMMFLEESVSQNIAVNRPLGESADRRISDAPSRDVDLERSYFGNEEQDEIRTRTAAPRRKLLR